MVSRGCPFLQRLSDDNNYHLCTWFPWWSHIHEQKKECELRSDIVLSVSSHPVPVRIHDFPAMLLHPSYDSYLISWPVDNRDQVITFCLCGVVSPGLNTRM